MNGNQGQQIGGVRDYQNAAIPEPTRAIPGAIENLHHAVSDVQGAVGNLLRRLENIAPGGLTNAVKGSTETNPKAVRSHVCDQIANATDALRMLVAEVSSATERIEL